MVFSILIFIHQFFSILINLSNIYWSLSLFTARIVVLSIYPTVFILYHPIITPFTLLDLLLFWIIYKFHIHFHLTNQLLSASVFPLVYCNWLYYMFSPTQWSKHVILCWLQSSWNDYKNFSCILVPLPFLKQNFSWPSLSLCHFVASLSKWMSLHLKYKINNI